jgi:hypothetical protein
MHKLTFFGAAVLFLTFSVGAALPPRPFSGRDSLIETTHLLEDAIRSLDKSSAQPRKIIEHTLRALPPEGNAAVRQSVREFLLRLPVAKEELVCGPDFLRSRAQQEFSRIKESFLNGPAEPLEPAACYSAPFLIDLTRNPEPQGTLDLFGYDFDRVPLELVLVHNGSFIDVTHALTMRSHSHLTVKLGNDGVRFSTDTEMIGLVWGHIIRYTIPVVQTSTTLCASRTEKIAADVTIRYSPPRIARAAGLRNAKRSVHAYLTLESVSNALSAMLCATVTSDKEPVFSGCGAEQLFTTGTDDLIEQIIGGTHSTISFTDTSQPSSRILHGSSGGPVAGWTFTGTAGADGNSAGPEVATQLKRVRIISTPAAGCLSPIAYLEAKRTNLLSQGTIRRLDDQLAKIDPDILKLRPRFAPPTATVQPR